MLKLKLKNLPDQIELIKALGSRNPAILAEAQEAFAAFIGPVINKVLLTAGTSNLIYTTTEFDEDDSPSYPLDLYYNEDAGLIPVWSQSMAGGLPTAEVSGMAEMKIATYPLDTAVSYAKKYARKARLDIISKALERMAQEVLIKQERNAWAVVLKALGEARSNGTHHFITSNAADVFIPDDISRLITLVKRINVSFSQNTVAGGARGLTDLFVSPEIKEQVRGFAYNPINTVGSKSTGPVALPEGVRTGIYNAAGTDEIFGVHLTDLVELGTTRKYNVLFSQYAPASVAHSSATFDPSAHEVLIGLDLSREAFIRPLARGADTGGTLTVLPDDQWPVRAEKAGFYAKLEEGRACIDGKVAVGLIV